MNCMAITLPESIPVINIEPIIAIVLENVHDFCEVTVTYFNPRNFHFIH